MGMYKPKIVAFLCNWCAYDGADAAGRARLEIPSAVVEVRVMCSGQVDSGMVLNAFEAGAQGVMVLGCQPGDCHYKKGNLNAMKRMALLRAVLKPTRIDPRRLRLDWVSAGDGKRYARVAREMVDTIEQLGPATQTPGNEHQ
ncbi:hypothetical protein DSCW_36780 [Desulfosarcina widdelii]|uniref:F420-non-reducing hydrogenase iron-sulfur subunit D domain-containing protein n=1 Tax=Desulfosarcina widdelii TaxID=947919 RepID=A0A5K7Z975_9BACT|nr:hydrogenase iron-sulfur subunit [Desulfosarcina widdelii]BBO76261.1 hypothetical protein DSCW_36780 [Desulfosarcina widdelii]